MSGRRQAQNEGRCKLGRSIPGSSRLSLSGGEGPPSQGSGLFDSGESTLHCGSTSAATKARRSNSISGLVIIIGPSYSQIFCSEQTERRSLGGSLEQGVCQSDIDPIDGKCSSLERLLNRSTEWACGMRKIREGECMQLVGWLPSWLVDDKFVKCCA